MTRFGRQLEMAPLVPLATPMSPTKNVKFIRAYIFAKPLCTNNFNIAYLYAVWLLQVNIFSGIL